MDYLLIIRQVRKFNFSVLLFLYEKSGERRRKKKRQRWGGSGGQHVQLDKKMYNRFLFLFEMIVYIREKRN